MLRRPHHSDDDDDDDAPPAAVSLASSKAAAKERSQLERDTRSGAAAANKFARKERAAAQTGDLRTDATPFPVELLPDVAAELEPARRAAPPPTVDGDGGAAAARRRRRRRRSGARARVHSGARSGRAGGWAARRREYGYAVLPPADSLSLGLAPSQSGLREPTQPTATARASPARRSALRAAAGGQLRDGSATGGGSAERGGREAAAAGERRAQQPKAPRRDSRGDVA